MVKRRNDVDIDKVFTYLSHRLLGSSSDFYVDDVEKVNILLDLVTRTVEKGESNSVLVLGPHGVGKTVLGKISFLFCMELGIKGITKAFLLKLFNFIIIYSFFMCFLEIEAF